MAVFIPQVEVLFFNNEKLFGKLKALSYRHGHHAQLYTYWLQVPLSLAKCVSVSPTLHLAVLPKNLGKKLPLSPTQEASWSPDRHYTDAGATSIFLWGLNSENYQNPITASSICCPHLRELIKTRNKLVMDPQTAPGKYLQVQTTADSNHVLNVYIWIIYSMSSFKHRPILKWNRIRSS